MNAVLQILCILRKVFAALKMNVMIEALRLMSEGQFDVRTGPLKMQLKHAFLRPVFC